MKAKPKKTYTKANETQYSRKHYITDLEKVAKPVKKVEKPKSTSSKT